MLDMSLDDHVSLNARTTLTPYYLPLGGTLHEGLYALARSTRETAERKGISKEEAAALEAHLRRDADEAEGYVSILLYLCAHRAEVRDAAGKRVAPERARDGNDRRGKGPTVWRVGRPVLC